MTRGKITLSPELSLPVDAATETFFVLGKRGSGKSNTACRLVEQIHAAGVPFVVVDPVDNWWGIKSSSDGKGPGLAAYIFGGSHADLPLTAEGGVVVASTICEHRCSAVLSIKHLSGAARGRFVTDFAQTMLDRWSGGALHLILEEAHEVAPQNPMAGDEKMLGAIVRLWKLGRAQGIGGTAVTQRPAALSKHVTTQSEVLVAHRTIGPQDVAAVGEWIKYHGERSDVLGQLSALPTGEAFVWAPDFPTGKPIGLVHAHILRRETFDSAATPKVGEKRVEPKQLAPVDLDQIRGAMAEVVQRAAADDPKLLRAEIKRLERELAAKPAPALEPKIERIEVPALSSETVAEVRAISEKLEASILKLGALAAEVLERTRVAAPRTDAARRFVVPHRAIDPPNERFSRPKARRSVEIPTTNGTESASLTRGMRAMLAALSRGGRDGLSRSAIGTLSLIASNGGTFGDYLSRLRVAGLIIEDSTGLVALTAAGKSAADPVHAPRSSEHLVEAWCSKLGGGASRMLRALVDAYPQGLTRQGLGERAEIAWTGGTFGDYLSRLRVNGLLEETRDVIRASEVLFL